MTGRNTTDVLMTRSSCTHRVGLLSDVVRRAELDIAVDEIVAYPRSTPFASLVRLSPARHAVGFPPFTLSAFEAQ